jgi:futalosine hydrolase
MKILLASATELEMDLHSFHLRKVEWDKEIDLLITGVGVASAIYNITKNLLQTKYELVIQAGIAGSFTDDLQLGEVVLVREDTFADCGVEENKVFKTLFNCGLANENDFPFIKGWLINKNDFLDTGFLRTTKAITVNKITNNKKQINQQKNFFNADIESMEGAALHYVCLQTGVPFLQVRSISNKVGQRDKTKWKMKEAISNLNNEVVRLLKSFYLP